MLKEIDSENSVQRNPTRNQRRERADIRWASSEALGLRPGETAVVERLTLLSIMGAGLRSTRRLPLRDSPLPSRLRESIAPMRGDTTQEPANHKPMKVSQDIATPAWSKGSESLNP
jgi:hypothetical protein